METITVSELFHHSNAHDVLTCQSWAHEGVLVGGIAHPLLAALPRHLHSTWHRAVRTGQSDVHPAKWHATHGAVQTRALIFAAALEGLAAAIHHSVKHAGGTFSCCGAERNDYSLQVWKLSWSLRPCVCHSHLCKLRCDGRSASRSHSKGLCECHRRLGRCTAHPAAWHTLGSIRRGPVPGSRRADTGEAYRGTGIARCTPEPLPEEGDRMFLKHVVHFWSFSSKLIVGLLRILAFSKALDDGTELKGCPNDSTGFWLLFSRASHTSQQVIERTYPSQEGQAQERKYSQSHPRNHIDLFFCVF